MAARLRKGEIMGQRMQWTPACRLDIEAINAQHRLLFAIANEMPDFDDYRDQLPEFKYPFNHLRRYIDEHFKYEEDFLQSINYPDLQQHQGNHQKIIAGINGLLQESKNLNQLHLKLQSLLRRWIKDHILVEDKRYAQWYHRQT
jgi:hemerythrin